MCFFPVEWAVHHLFCKIERSEMKHSVSQWNAESASRFLNCIIHQWLTLQEHVNNIEIDMNALAEMFRN